VDLATVIMFLMALEGGGQPSGPQPVSPVPPGPIPPPPPPPPPPAPMPVQPPPHMNVQPAPVAPPPVVVVPIPGGIPHMVLPHNAPKPAPPPAPPPPVPPPAPWPTPVQPQGLPPFPGPGWSACATTPDIVARAQYWNPQLWNYASKTIVRPTVQEQLGGRWVTFKAAWHPGTSGPQTFMATEAYCLTSPGPSPGPLPVTGKPPPVGVYPGTGAYSSNAAYITRYQTALAWLSFVMNQPTWNPNDVSGQYSPSTQNAVTSFQAAQGLTPDAQCGGQTADAIDVAMGYPPSNGSAPAPSQSYSTNTGPEGQAAGS